MEQIATIEADDEVSGAQRPSLGRRILAFPLTLLVVEFVIVAVAALLAGFVLRLAGHSGSNGPMQAIGGLVVGLAALVAYGCCQRWIERRADHELAVSAAPSVPSGPVELGAGLLGGFLLFSVMTGVVWLLGGIQFSGIRGWGQIWPLLGMALYSGPVEEALFRGVVMRHLESLIGTWAALAVTAAFFGGAHLMNPHASLFAAFAIAVEAGLLLGAAYLLTRRLWLAIGIHAAWNFTQGWVFSVPVSGSAAPLGLLVTRRVGPEWLTGGDFGLEASAVAMVFATLAGVALLVMAMRRGAIQPPMWRR